MVELLVSCAPNMKSNDNPTPQVSETSYCGTNTNVANPVIISGLAKYQYYKATILGLTKDTGNIPFESPIRRAEVRVTTADGTVLQCGETDNNGQISIEIEKPSVPTNYIVEVNSRGSGSYVNASILDKPSLKGFYSTRTSITIDPSDSARTISDLVAPATGSLEGGAFYIFDRILMVNEYLRNNTTDPNCTLCSAFTVAPKVTVYWSKGFNPASYFGESSGLSFFDSSGSVDSTPGLYILGGSSGDVDDSDTDHFDESVIIHEYGHFLESQYWKTDSPGGYHNGNMIIDPRLAFSEGFANFLPSAVLGTKHYIDTLGSPDGNPGVGVYLNLENEPSTSNPNARDKILTKTPIGEGIYREVSISRVLYDFIDIDQDSTYDSNGADEQGVDTANFSFGFIWNALTNSSFGLNSSNQHFVSMGHLNKAIYEVINQSSFSNIPGEKAKLDTARIGEFQREDTLSYASLLTQSDVSCDKTITPYKDRSVGDGSYYHDIFASSHFYRLDHPGGALNLSLTFNTTGSPIPDLDLYVYYETHNLSESGDIAAASDFISSIGQTTGTESISKSLPAGSYLVLVNVCTSGSTDCLNGVNFIGNSSATYSLTSGGKYLCPTP